MNCDRAIVIGSDGRVVELCDQVRAERLAKHRNAETVRRRRDKKIVRVYLDQVSDDSRVIVHRGNPRRYSHDHETETNPPRVWTMRRLGAPNDPEAEQYVREIYRASILDNLTTEAPPKPQERPRRKNVVMFPSPRRPQEKKAA